MTIRSLHLAKDLTLPLDAVTQTFLIVGKRGSGKSNTAARFVEQLHRARLPFVVLDPVDTWWGLKAGREGGEGLGVYVFGGRHADLPLEAGGGVLIAEVLCEHRMPMVLSVKHLSGRERSGFMVAFAQTLFQEWGGGPLHVVLEEAHELAPQMGARERGAVRVTHRFRLWSNGPGIACRRIGAQRSNERVVESVYAVPLFGWRIWLLGRRVVNGYVVDGSETDWESPLVTDQWTEVLAAHRRGHGLCGICAEPVDLTIERGPKQPTIDHIIPTSKGGTDERSNLQVAHRGCNSRKGNR